MKALVLIDGSNFYHKLKNLKLEGSKFNYTKFCKYLAKGEDYTCIYYVGIIRQEKNNKKGIKMYAKQRSFLAGLEKEKINIYGGHILKTEGVYHEKGVDVKIALDLAIGAYENEYEKAYLVSSDTDLIPAVESAVSKARLIQYVGFAHNPSYALIKACSSSQLLSKEDLFQFIEK